MTYLIDYHFWPLVYPFIFRYNRCNYYDVAAVDVISFRIYTYVNEKHILDDEIISPVWKGSPLISDIISFSELFDYSWTTEDENNLMK